MPSVLGANCRAGHSFGRWLLHPKAYICFFCTENHQAPFELFWLQFDADAQGGYAGLDVFFFGAGWTARDLFFS